MKATFNNIVENLVKVLTDKAESAQYYSDNEQYTGICGWCGVMSPASRPAYIKTFGKDTTEAAEAKAREIIAEKEAARQRTKYAEHAQEADRLEGVPAVGGFFWADNSGLKCDGGRGTPSRVVRGVCYPDRRRRRHSQRERATEGRTDRTDRRTGRERQKKGFFGYLCSV